MSLMLIFMEDVVKRFFGGSGHSSSASMPEALCRRGNSFIRELLMEMAAKLILECWISGNEILRSASTSCSMEAEI